MPAHRVIGGHIVTTPEGVFAHYKPDTNRIPNHEWRIVQPVAIAACRAADYSSVASALSCMSTVTYFIAWALRQSIPLDLEQVFLPDHVERYCVTMLKDLASETRSTRRGYLRRVGRACTKKAPWAPDPKPFSENLVIQPPYSASEVDALWEAAETQATDHRRRVATALLTLGLGAGLKPGEMLHVDREKVKYHREDSRLAVIFLPGRMVPVRYRYRDKLARLCDDHPNEPLVGLWSPNTKDPLSQLRKKLQWPDWITFRPARLRTTWMVDILSGDVRVSEFMDIAGTVSSKTLEVIAPYVPRRVDNSVDMFAGAGLVREEQS